MEIRRIKIDIGVAIFFILFAILLWLYIIPVGIPLKASWGGDVGVNSRTFPYFSTLLIGLCALLMLIINIGRLIKTRPLQPKKSESTIIGSIRYFDELRAIVTFILFVIYGIAFGKIGFIATTLIISPIVLFLYGERTWKRWPLYLSVYIFAAVLYLSFNKLLMVQLP